MGKVDRMRSLKRLVPEGIRSRVRHAQVWRTRYNRREAKRLAGFSKRLDLCAAQFAHLLHLSGHGLLRGKVCLEVGSGWVLSHALVCHLLGAKRVIASDLEGLARPSYLTGAIQEAVPYIVRDVLSPFEEHQEVRRRLDALLAVDLWTFPKLREFGVEYVAPVDLAKRPIGRPVDFIYSFSTLEHVPLDDVHALLQNLASDLAPGGAMIHCIHLEDHQSIADAPFAFLGEPSYSKSDEIERGNRLRRSGWQATLSGLERLDSRFIYEWSRTDRPLPAQIAAAVRYADEDDLRVSHVGTYSVRRGAAVP
jgi:Methyltransferase domain